MIKNNNNTISKFVMNNLIFSSFLVENVSYFDNTKK